MGSLMERLKGVQRRCGVRPRTYCLVSGPPRSGTTAVTRWLGEQPGVISLSESRILVAAHEFLQQVKRLRRLAKGREELERRMGSLVFGYYSDRHWLLGRTILVDKEPLGHIALRNGDYSEFLDNVRRLEPAARTIIMIRDPVATIWSMQQRAWGYSVVGVEPQRNSLEEDIANWRAAAAAVVASAGAPRTYVCHFGRMVEQPLEESRRILRFLRIRGGSPFEPVPTKDVGFSESETAMILERTAPEVRALRRSDVHLSPAPGANA